MIWLWIEYTIYNVILISTSNIVQYPSYVKKCYSILFYNQKTKLKKWKSCCYLDCRQWFIFPDLLRVLWISILCAKSIHKILKSTKNLPNWKLSARLQKSNFIITTSSSNVEFFFTFVHFILIYLWDWSQRYTENRKTLKYSF